MRVAGADTVRRYATVNTKMLWMASAAGLRDLWFIWLTTCCFNILFCVFGQCSSLCLLARLQILTQLELQLVLEQCHRCPFLLQTGAIGVGDVYVFLAVCFLHCATGYRF